MFFYGHRYLEKMGVTDTALRSRLTKGLPGGGGSGSGAGPSTGTAAGIGDATAADAASTAAAVAAAIKPLNDARRCDASMEPLFVLCDAGGLPAHVARAVAGLRRACYSLELPARSVLTQIKSVDGLASMYCSLIKAAVPRAPPGGYLVAAVGAACVVGYEVATQLQDHGETVQVSYVARISEIACSRHCCVLARLPRCMHVIWSVATTSSGPVRAPRRKSLTPAPSLFLPPAYTSRLSASPYTPICLHATGAHAVRGRRAARGLAHAAAAVVPGAPPGRGVAAGT